MTQRKKNLFFSDNAGITSAVLCTIHCLIVPVLFLIKCAWGPNETALLPSWWHLLDYLFLIISFWAVFHSASHSGSGKIKASLWLFWILLAIAIFFEHDLHWLAYIASAGLVTTHLVNIMRLKKVQSSPAIPTQANS